VRPGAAAIVGEQRIPVDSLQEVVERGLADPQAEEAVGDDREGFQRQVLSRLVNREVLREAAEREGVTVDDGAVDAQLQEFAAQAGGREALERRPRRTASGRRTSSRSCATSCSSRRSGTR
jgi:FKBP-type peptidyl-prolyl cis-trans isomerase (trigger factor)